MKDDMMVSEGKGPSSAPKGEGWADRLIGESDTSYFSESCKLHHISDFFFLFSGKKQLEI